LISQYNQSLGGDTTLITYKNFDHDNSIGFEMNANLFITNWWRLNVSGSGFYYQINKQDAYSNNSRESFNYNFKFDNSFSLKSKTKIQLTGFYRGPSVTAQGTSEGFFFSNLAIRQDLLKGKLTLTAQLQDIFGSAKMKSASEYETTMSPTLTIKQNISQVFMREARVVTFSLTYRLNNFKQKRSGDKPDDVEMDMDMSQ